MASTIFKAAAAVAGGGMLGAAFKLDQVSLSQDFFKVFIYLPLGRRCGRT